jgi:hypothetical protein
MTPVKKITRHGSPGSFRHGSQLADRVKTKKTKNAKFFNVADVITRSNPYLKMNGPQTFG